MNRLLILIIIISFIVGWLFPVEGPLDWTYDKYASQPARFRPQKAPTRITPLSKPIKEILIDLNEDEELEEYFIVPKKYEIIELEN